MASSSQVQATKEVQQVLEILANCPPWLPAIDSSLPRNFYTAFVLHGLSAHLLQPGRLLCSLTLPAHLLNDSGMLHGGATAALVELVGSAAIDSAGPRRHGATVEVNVSYLGSAHLGEEIEIEAKVLKVGSVVGVVTVEIRKTETGTVIAQGRYTKNLAVSSKI